MPSVQLITYDYKSSKCAYQQLDNSELLPTVKSLLHDQIVAKEHTWNQNALSLDSMLINNNFSDKGGMTMCARQSCAAISFLLCLDFVQGSEQLDDFVVRLFPTAFTKDLIIRGAVCHASIIKDAYEVDPLTGVSKNAACKKNDYFLSAETVFKHVQAQTQTNLGVNMKTVAGLINPVPLQAALRIIDNCISQCESRKAFVLTGNFREETFGADRVVLLRSIHCKPIHFSDSALPFMSLRIIQFYFIKRCPVSYGGAETSSCAVRCENVFCV
jgi:hypothetical protein